MIADIHTHRLDAADAVISVNPWEFVPTEGKLYSVGIHPWQLGLADEGCFMQVEALVSCDNVVMVGECGIDKLRGGDISRQTEVAEWHAVLAERVGETACVALREGEQRIVPVAAAVATVDAVDFAWFPRQFTCGAAVARCGFFHFLRGPV